MAKIGRPRKNAEQEALTKAVQGIYKAYCMYVHNMDFFTNENAEEKDMKWKLSKFHADLCDRVQEFVEKPTDKAYEIMIISTPPQHGKSTTITETLLSWYIMKHPDDSVIQVSYGDDLAERFGKRNLEKVREHGGIFGVEVDPKKATSREFQILNHKGRVISKGIGSGLTGHSGHLIVIDDPIKNRGEADSERTRDSVWNEFKDSILTRTQAGSKIILIMTRWHEDDLAGRILENMADVTTYVNYECECVSKDDPLGRKPQRKGKDGNIINGEALCPEIGKGEKWLKWFKESYIAGNFEDGGGLRSWEALYQGHPTIQEGNMIKKSWWEYYNVQDYYDRQMTFQRIIMSVDAAYKDSERNDYVAIEIWGVNDGRYYLIDLVNEHLSLNDTMNVMRAKAATHPHLGAIYIEDAANGPAIINTLKNMVSGIIPVKVRDSKEGRVEGIAYLIEAHNVYLPRDREFTHKFVEQCAKFPNDKHDDMVDAMTMALTKLKTSRGKVWKKIEDVTGWKLPHEKPRKKVDIGGTINVV